MTATELLHLARHGAGEGTIELDEQRMIERIFAFEDLRARDVMIPRPLVFVLPAGDVDRRALREAMVRNFGLEDLEVLCADVEGALKDAGLPLQVNLEIVGGSGKRAKVLNLIQYLDRRGYLGYLVDAVRSVRPGII